MSSIKNVNDASINTEVLNSEIPVLAYFTAPWVNECSLLTPALEELAGEYSGRIKIVHIDTDENDVSTQRYGIKAMPTIIMFQDGKAVSTLVGTRSKNQLDEIIRKFI